MDSIVRIAAAVKAERRRLKLTQAALAQRAGISLRTFQRLEQSDGAARIDSLFRVLDALGLEMITTAKRRPTLEQLSAIYDDE